MKRGFSFAVLVAVIALMPLAAQAGQPVNQAFTCRPGSFLVGVEGHTGNWVDRFQPVCQLWNSATQALGAQYDGDTFGNMNGGSPDLRRAVCDSGSVMVGLRYNVVTPNGPPGHVQGIVVRCAILPYMNGVREIGLDAPVGGVRSSQLFCDDSAVANGRTGTVAKGLVIGLDGVNVASLDLECETQAHVMAGATPLRIRLHDAMRRAR